MADEAALILRSSVDSTAEAMREAHKLASLELVRNGIIAAKQQGRSYGQ